MLSRSRAHGKFLSERKIKDASPFARSKQGMECQNKLGDELMIKLEEIVSDITTNYTSRAERA